MTAAVQAPARTLPASLWLALAVSMASVVALGMARSDQVLYFDDGVIAHNVVEGKGFSLPVYAPEAPTASRAPYQPLILAAVHALFGYSTSALFVVLVLRALSLATAASLSYLIALRVMARRRAVLLGAVVALHPGLLWLAANSAYLDRRVIVSLPLGLVAVWTCLLARERRDGFRVLLAGCCVGLAALSEPPLFYMAVPVGLLVGAPTGRYARCLGLVTLGALLVAGPWLLRNAVVFERALPLRVAFGTLLWVGNNPGSSGLLLDQIADVDERAEPSSKGLFSFRPHVEHLSFRAANTLPPDVVEAWADAGEARRDSMLLDVALGHIKEDPLRFLRLSVRRVGHVIYGPPLSQRFVDAVDGAAAGFLPLASRSTQAGSARPSSFVAAAIHAYFGAGFFLAVLSILRDRSAALLLIGFVLSTWMVFYGVTHCGLTEYRTALEPWVLVAAASLSGRLQVTKSPN